MAALLQQFSETVRRKCRHCLEQKLLVRGLVTLSTELSRAFFLVGNSINYGEKYKVLIISLLAYSVTSTDSQCLQHLFFHVTLYIHAKQHVYLE